AYGLAVKAGLPDAVNVLVAQLGVIAAARGGELLDEVLELAARHGPPPMFQVFAALSQALGLVIAGRREEARAVFRAGLARTDPVPGPSLQLYLMAVAELAYQLGDAEAARSVRDQLTPYADRFIVTGGAVGCGGAVSRLLGLCARALGRADEAVGWLRDGVASNRRIGAAPFVARAQAELA